MNTDEITVWKESIIQLPDNSFFDLMQLYLGKLQTPFNKQKLIERLSAFLSKLSIQEIIAKTLSDSDILILTAIEELHEPTQSILVRLFEKKIPYRQLYDFLLNMEERLLIYREKKSENEKVYKINPLLKKTLKPFLDKTVFFLAEKKEILTVNELNINDTFFASLYSFCFHNGLIFKNNGIIKKKCAEKLIRIIPCLAQKENIIENIFSACENLGLLFKSETNTVLQKQKWKAFAELNSIEKHAYFLTASVFKLRKENIQILSQLLIEFLYFFEPDCLYERNDAEFLFFFLCAKMLDNTYLQPEVMQENFEHKITELIDILVFYGIICTKKNLIYRNPEYKISSAEPKKPLLIDSSFEVTVLPDSNLNKLLDVCEAMEPILIQTAGRFKITKKTCARFFQNGFSGIELFDMLVRLTDHSLPQNIIVSISEWYSDFTAISVYSGFVVSVSKEKEKLFMHDTPIKKLVRKKLGDGVYLLNIHDIKEFEQAVILGGIEFIFYKDKPDKYISNRGFQKLNLNIKKENFKLKEKKEWTKEQIKRNSDYKTVIDELNLCLNEKNLSEDDKKNIHERINRKAIITKEQITNIPTKFEKSEAGGLDFFGKQRIVETALAGNKFLEIHLVKGTKTKKIVCMPQQVVKYPDDAVLIGYSVPKRENLTISIAQILKIKLIRTTILS